MAAFNISIYEQYINTNIEKLINGKSNVKEYFILNAINSLKNEIMDLKTAKGDALDMWGRILGFSRYIPIANKDEIEEYELLYNNFIFYDTNYINLKFKDNLDIEYAALNDAPYRTILQLIYQSRNIPPTIENIKKLVTQIINAPITIKDNFNMSYNIYYKKNNLDRWLQFILGKYDIIPRPAGVAIHFISSIWKIFGFRTDNEQYNNDILTNFWNAQFEGGRTNKNFFEEELLDLENIKQQITLLQQNIINIQKYKPKLLDKQLKEWTKTNLNIPLLQLDNLKNQIDYKKNIMIENETIILAINDINKIDIYKNIINSFDSLKQQITNFIEGLKNDNTK